MNREVICIAGAHRSGTSMLTRLLRRCGLDLGPEEQMMAPASDNPDGFWENIRFVQLNDEFLNAVGSAWDLPPRQDEKFEGDRLRPMHIKAQLLIGSFAGRSHWGWKDPRNCLTMPFWRKILPDLKTVIIVRNPLEAAYSMHKRNGTSYALGLRLWEIYNRRLIAHTSPNERIVTDYRIFFEKPESELKRIAAFAGLPENAAVAAAAIVNKERRHTTFTMEQLIDAGVSAEILALYDSLNDEASDSSVISASAEGVASKPAKRRASKVYSAGQPNQLAGAASELNFAVPDAEPIRRELAWRRGAEVQYRETLGQHQARIEELMRELSAKSERAALEIGIRDGRIMELQAAYAHLDQTLLRELAGRDKLVAELERLHRQVTEQTAGREKLASELEGLRLQATEQAAGHDKLLAEQASLRERFVQTNRLLHAQSVRLAEHEASSASLSERLRHQLRETKRLVRLFEDIERAAERLRESRRWILANLFTWLGAKLSGRSLPGFGYLDKNVEKYRAWRSARPEIAHLDEAMAALRPRESSFTPVSAGPEIAPEPQSSSAIEPVDPIQPIEFPIHDEVEVSIVIPVFNQLHFTQACLASLQQHVGAIACEVILVDDCSTDATSDTTRRLPGVSYLRNESNAGFVVSCNRGAAAARGKYLVFLNNDTTVKKGWLSSLLETFQLEPEAGLVGSKLIYPDGRLQEAGGIVWRDGSAWNRGKFKDANDPEYNYLREVDYCSAASVMIPKSLFESVGGFEHKYSPGYYEDTDLAFKVRRIGRKVLYQPLSEVIHYEGATGGTDLSTGAKKHQDINRMTFADSWASELARKPKNGDVASHERLGREQKCILVVDHHLPMTDRDAGSVRMFHILNILRNLGHRVTFLPDNIADIPPYGDELRKRGVEFFHHPYCKSVRDYLAKYGSRFDVVILSRCDFARKHIADARHYAPQSRIIFDTVDLHHLRLSREAKLTKDSTIEASAKEAKEREYQLIDEADETWVVSAFEQSLLAKERPDKSIEVVPTIVDTPGSNTPFAFRRDFLFIGSFQHTPNVDAVIFFTNEVFPLVVDRLSGVRFYIIGDKAPPAVIALASENIVITGWQPDIRPYFESVRLSVAPLRFGAGVKGKINQSMGFGVPVVATTVAVEGMVLTNREDILIADDPEAFASALIDLYESEELWTRVSEKGVKKTAAMFSTEVARKQLSRLFGDNDLRSSDRRRSDSKIPVWNRQPGSGFHPVQRSE